MNPEARMRGPLRVGLLLIALLLAAPAASQAATFTVTKTDDTADGTCDSDCSLREAIDEANNSGEADTINVPAGTYVLDEAGTGEDANDTGDLDVLDDGVLTVNGAGRSDTIVDAESIDRVLHLLDGATLSASGITLRDGFEDNDGGGGIFASDNTTLNLTDAALTDNTEEDGSDGGGLKLSDSTAVATLTRTTVARNSADDDGGGIASFGDLTVIDSTITGNTADSDGGGIFADGTALQVTGSTVSHNSSDSTGGIRNCNDAQIANSTITENVGDFNLGGVGAGGIDHECGTLDLVNVTIADNRGGDDVGGIEADDAVSVKNTIIARNQGGESDPDDCEGPGNITSNGNNLESGSDCGFTASGDIQNGDPKLGPLADNGGPTRTHALLPGSQAIAAGDNSACPATDQRGAARPGGSVCDIGAFEADALADLALVDKSAAPSPGTVGQRLTYTLVVVNNGPDDAPGVRVQDDIPNSATFVSATPSQGSCSGGDPVVCDLGTLGAGDVARVQVVVEPREAGTLTNSGSVSSAATDPVADNNGSVIQTTVNPAPAAPAERRPAVISSVAVSSRNTVSLRTLLRGVRASADCDRPCTLRFRLLARGLPGDVEVAQRRRSRVRGFNRTVARGFAPFGDGRRRVTLRPCVRQTGSRRQSPRCLERLSRQLKSELRRKRRFFVKLQVTATSADNARNVTTSTIAVRR